MKIVEKIVPTVLDLEIKPEYAKARAAKAKAFVEQRQKETLNLRYCGKGWQKNSVSVRVSIA
ncbi:hypothetical protein [Rubinisphaera sp.]|uniref:hypothetical protein n=1 Tax=Rubinisphaera sp. TaxID=2024857 RepID=UPI000C0CE1F9|nr:hypothetical protein [Rubinisphaera sp.]MBV09348.1 hypothetical protein [Rubinisphaera sp.]HCS52869.1 hypothetical protein [Planctomycetaceae bacterium]|tara:strand:+ start:674 stop:859 length:186 start_codon:yes stop_codon:yes gene_type:complete